MMGAMGAMSSEVPAVAPFRFLFRVRYHECDAQKIVFNARWAEYVDVATAEFCRALFGSIDPEVGGFDWRLVRQTVEWKGPGRFDDVLEAEVETARIGTTSFTLTTRFRRLPDGPLLVTAETVYVAVRPGTAIKQPLSDNDRRALEGSGRGVTVDHAGAGAAGTPT